MCRAGAASWPAKTTWAVAAVLATFCVLAQCVSQRYRFCAVKDDDKDRVITKYCPMLKGDGSRVECVYGNSRIDCLRLIAKGDADFSVFQAEDLLVARKDKAGDFVITHRMQSSEKEEFEYRLVAIVRKSANINSLKDLKNQNLCHPGHGYEVDWTEVEGKFFEERVVPQNCDSDLTLRENLIKSSSMFFKAACKAGLWVPDVKQDAALKAKYSNLCSLCDRPKLCSKLDKYWGRTGPLYCLTDGFGDVAWARLDDMQFHFGLTPDAKAVANVGDYSFLCDDGSRVPLNSSNPCSWLDRPWPVIMAQRYAAVGIQKLISNLKSTSDINWQQAIQQLLDAYRLSVQPLSSTKIPEDYLESVPGFLSANSIIHCDRHIKLCTYTDMSFAKCNWLSEAAVSNGVEPGIVCQELDTVEGCMEDVSHGDSDAVLIESDYLTTAIRKHKLIPLLREYISSATSSYNIVAVVLTNSSIKTLEDLKGKRACFTQYDGAGWNTVIQTLKNQNLLPTLCPYEKAIGTFFSNMCLPGLSNSSSHTYIKNICENPVSAIKFSGELGALECLRSGLGDVAFASLSAISRETENGSTSWLASMKYKEFSLLCPSSSTKDCYLSWATPGQIMVRVDTSRVKFQEMKMVFKYMDNLFGKGPRIQKATFQIFAPFDGYKNILFHDETEHLEDATPSFGEEKPRSYEDVMKDTAQCSTASWTMVGILPFLTTSIVFIVKRALV